LARYRIFCDSGLLIGPAVATATAAFDESISFAIAEPGGTPSDFD